MARPRAFDEDTVLTAAMHAFRRDGYSGATVRTLEGATGLRVSSLYNAFGDKDGLHRRAVDHYVRTLVEGRLAAHAGPEATLDDLEGLFLSLFQAPYDDGFGCLVVNSLVELPAEDPTAARARRGSHAVSRAVHEVVRRETGDETGAAELVLLYHGLLVLSRGRLLDHTHQEAVRRAFDALRERKASTT